VHGIFELTL